MYMITRYSETPLGPTLTVLFMEVSLFQRFSMYICQCEGAQQCCPEGGGCISEVSFNRGFPVSPKEEKVTTAVHALNCTNDH